MKLSELVSKLNAIIETYPEVGGNAKVMLRKGESEEFLDIQLSMTYVTEKVNNRPNYEQVPVLLIEEKDDD